MYDNIELKKKEKDICLSLNVAYMPYWTV